MWKISNLIINTYYYYIRYLPIYNIFQIDFTFISKGIIEEQYRYNEQIDTDLNFIHSTYYVQMFFDLIK